MKKGLKIFLFAIAFGFIALSYQPVKAQCAICAANVSSNVKDGRKTAGGLNNGIVYLLGAPYIAITALGLLWYKKYRRKNVDLNMRSEKLNLN
jgi:hypothetical protein